MTRTFCDLCGGVCVPHTEGPEDDHTLLLMHADDGVPEHWNLSVDDCCMKCAKRIHDHLVSAIQHIKHDAQLGQRIREAT